MHSSCLCAFIWTSVSIEANFLFRSVPQLELNKQATSPCCQSGPVNYNQETDNVHIPPFAHGVVAMETLGSRLCPSMWQEIPPTSHRSSHYYNSSLCKAALSNRATHTHARAVVISLPHCSLPTTEAHVLQCAERNASGKHKSGAPPPPHTHSAALLDASGSLSQLSSGPNMPRIGG